MSILEKVIKLRIQEVLDHERELPFPDFVRSLRKMTGFSREDVNLYLGIHPMMLYFLESGRFYKMPSEDQMIKLAAFYDVPKKILLEKAKEFLDLRFKPAKKRRLMPNKKKKLDLFEEGPKKAQGRKENKSGYVGITHKDLIKPRARKVAN